MQLRHTHDAKGKRVWQRLHRFVLKVNDPRKRVDHKNGNGLLCYRSNLRFVSALQSAWNRGIYKNNTSGCTGVYFAANKWRARLSVKGKQMYFGSFNTKTEAIQAITNARKIHHKNFNKHRRKGYS